MNTRTLLLPLALAGALSACASEHHAEAHEHGHAMDHADAEADAMMHPDEMMAAWMKFGTPGTQHLGLAALAGRWNLKLKQWMAPDTEPEMSDATTTFESFGGGRYLIERAEGVTSMGPFHGMGITGFNNRTGRFFNIWIDNYGTGVMHAEGEGDANARHIRYTGSFDEPMGGGTQPFRSELRKVNDNILMYEMWMKMGGAEFKSMEITYTRA